MACINIKHPEYINLVNKLSEFGITNPVDIQGKIHEYQEETNTDLFPGLDYFNIEDEVVNDVLEKRQNKVQANQQQLSVIQPNKTIDNQFATSIVKNKDVIDSFKRKMEAIDGVFKDSPELAAIGSKAQYMQYLSTIFKTSKVKDIVYHGSRGDEKFETFKFTGVNKLSANVKAEDNTGIFFTDDPYIAATYGDGTFAGNYKVLLNIKNPIYPNTETVTSGSVGKYIGKYDGVIGQEPDHPGTNIVVFEPEQIHVLASKLDIKGFKDFMAFENSEFSKYGTYQQFIDFITNKSSMEIENKLIETGKIDRVC